MAISSRFAVAVHMLTLLERAGGEPVTSEQIARSANTNPALIRRLQCVLSRAGLTASRMGPGGGVVLARPGSEITLLDVYRAVEPHGRLFAMHPEGPNRNCPVGRHILLALEQATESARLALEAQLASGTVASVLRQIDYLEKAGSTDNGGR